jgi:hypothetical protein
LQLALAISQSEAEVQKNTKKSKDYNLSAKNSSSDRNDKLFVNFKKIILLFEVFSES